MSKPVLFCNRESGHSYKIALALTLMGVEFLAPWPAIAAWLGRIRSLRGWRAPYDLLEASSRSREPAGTRT